MRECSGRTAIITGSGRGIGFQIAKILSTAGNDIVMNDVNEERLVNAKKDLNKGNGELLTVTGDISDEEVAKDLVEATVQEFNDVDIVINNAGISGPVSPCEEITVEQFRTTLDVNLIGAFNVVKHAIPHLKNAQNGKIVNVSSRSAKEPIPNQIPYVTSKMALIAFTRALALELGQYNVNVNAVCPGLVMGERVDEKFKGQNTDATDVLEEAKDDRPLQSEITQEDVADLIMFLCSPHSSRITGQSFNITAGQLMQ